MILSVGSITAADADDSLSDSDLIDSVDNSNIDEVSAVDTEINDDALINSPEKTKEGASLQSNSLASTISFNEKSYTTYFNKSGNIISGKLNEGDILDFSGTFTGKMFIIDIPLTITSTDNTAYLKNCGFSFLNGSSGSRISNIKANTSVDGLSVISVSVVENMTLSNINIYSNGSGSYPMTLSNVNRINIFNNTLQSNGFIVGYGQPSALVLRNAGSCNISGNTVITNDSNGIYFTGFGASSAMGSVTDAQSYSNYIFNNTVSSVREFPSSFVYAIQVMSSNNLILNNTIFNVFRGVSVTGSGNQIIGNKISNVHGSYYSQSVEETGADYAIYAASNTIVKDNIISNCNFESDKKGSAIHAGKGSEVSGNILENITGMGAHLDGDNISFTYNDLNVYGYGAYIFGGVNNIEILFNTINSHNSSNIKMEKQSRRLYPNNILIANNTFYNSGVQAIESVSESENITIESNNIIVEETGNGSVDVDVNGTGGDIGNGSVNDDAVHNINESNFYNYFSNTGNLESIVKENDTIIFSGSFSSKNRIYINQKVNILGSNAIFNDTTFIINNDDVTIDNIKISNPNNNLKDRLWGIQLNGVNNVTIKNCDISICDPYSAYAIYILESSNCNIVNNTLEAKGNYFTVALLSFNSKNINVEGNTIRTIGSGEVYLINNKSCLDGYLSLCLDGSLICSDGNIVCPDRFEICSDGSLLCPDGSIISSDNFTLCVDGSILCTDGTVICADGSTQNGEICSDGIIVNGYACPDGSVVCSDGTVYCLDGTVILSNGTKLFAGGYSLSGDNSTLICPDGTVCTDGFTICEDGSIVCTDGLTICADGSIICADGTVICTDGSVICADGAFVCADGSIVCADGSVICPDGSILNGTVCADGSICADGKVYYSNGTVTYANGTVCTDGEGSTAILDGVIPGSHMVSGVYKTYGVLLIHTSNSNLINNVINVSSDLSSDYNLNESYNTIAGVFIHYGGFNNIISNNNIELASNDPVIYGIGIIGASPNSDAIGSKNNNFTKNNVSLMGPFYGVGITLGYKAIESNFIENNFEILTNYSFNVLTMAGSENNTLEENTFIKKLHTVLNVSNVTYNLNVDNKMVYVTIKDEYGLFLANKDIFVSVDGQNYTATTNENGMVGIKVDLSIAKSYNITANFKGNDYYFDSLGTGFITINKLKTTLSSSAKTYAVSAGTKSITVTLKDSNGKGIANKNVTAKVNGKTYKATTNSKGVATIKLNLNAVKTYNVSLKFAGDSYYSASSASVKVKVTKSKTKLSVPAKTYKRTAKTKKLTATLKTSDGKVLKSKKVRFTVNGKTYVAKTNSKGVATVKVKLTSKKTYKVTVKFAGDSSYYAVTKKSKVVIK